MSNNTRLDVEGILIYSICAGTCGVILNTLTIAVFVTGSKVGKGIKIQLISIATADILSGIFYIISLWDPASHIREIYGCRTVMFIGYGSMYASLCCKAGVSVERLFVIFFPLKARSYTKRRKVIAIVTVWLLGLASEFDIFIDDGQTASKGKSCYIREYPSWIDNDVYVWLRVSRYFIPFSIIVTSYTLIGVKIWRKTIIGEQPALEGHSSKSAYKYKVLLL